MTLHKKQSEEEMRDMFREMGWWFKKSPDRRRPTCPNCGNILSPCPRCRKDTMFKKATKWTDYMIAPSMGMFECKQGHTSWEVEDFTPIQVDALNEQARKKEPAFFFLLMGDGPVLKGGRKAWLVPWEDWVPIQKDVLAQGFKSIIFEATARTRNPVAGELLSKYELEWDNGHWNIPDSHPFNTEWEWKWNRRNTTEDQLR